MHSDIVSSSTTIEEVRGTVHSSYLTAIFYALAMVIVAYRSYKWHD